MTVPPTVPRPRSRTLTDEQQDYIDGLRAYTRLLCDHPALIPNHGAYFAHYCASGERLLDVRRQIGGRWEKTTDYEDPHYRISRKIGPHELGLFTERENVCERWLVGTRRVFEGGAWRDEDVHRWNCPDSLLRQVRA